MAWPAWLWIGTRLKFGVWLSNRVATWVGSFYVWTRVNSRRKRWWWLAALNAVSLGALVLVLFWLHRRSVH